MSWEAWRTVKYARCELINENVALESRLVFPADPLPDQPPRVAAFRCSAAENCERFDQPPCPWEGLSSPR